MFLEAGSTPSGWWCVWINQYWVLWLIALSIPWALLGRERADALVVKWFPLIMIGFAVLWAPSAILTQLRWGFDFPIYYWAGRGEFDHIIPRGLMMGAGWVYKDFTALLWFWCQYMSLPVAAALWYWLMIGASILTLRFVRKVPYAPALFLIFWPLEQVHFNAGNIQPFLILLSLSPLGALVAGLFKPYFLLFALGHAGRFGIQKFRERPVRHFLDNVWDA